jgi:hypothetical protein
LKREELEEFHYITPISNVLSIMTNGILSYNAAAKISHESCASSGVQQRRARVIVPNGKSLHDYANVYFYARNPMMHLLKDRHHGLAVLAVRVNILDILGVVISDRNAARDYALFKPALEGLEMIDKDLVFAERWTHQDPIKQHEHKGIMCAEILVPIKIDASYIFRAYVSCQQGYENLLNAFGSSASNLEIIINGHLFFN